MSRKYVVIKKKKGGGGGQECAKTAELDRFLHTLWTQK